MQTSIQGPTAQTKACEAKKSPKPKPQAKQRDTPQGSPEIQQPWDAAGGGGQKGPKKGIGYSPAALCLDSTLLQRPAEDIVSP